VSNFAQTVTRYAEKSGRTRDNIIVSGVVEIGTAVIRKTPRKTGAAKNNWFSSIGQREITSTRSAERDGASSQANLEGVAVNAPGNVYYMVNNLPYVTLLEYGSSKKQAPAGMVRLAIAKYRQNLKRLAL